MRVGIFLCICALLALDFFSKKWALAHIPFIHWGEGYPFHGIGIFQGGGISFSLNMVTNTGAAWGTFSSYPTALICVRIAVIAALSFFLFRFPLFSLPLWLVWIGAVGNVVDYWLYGCVIDFFHWTFWGRSFPVFNVADMCITLGALGLLLFNKGRTLCKLR